MFEQPGNPSGSCWLLCNLHAGVQKARTVDYCGGMDIIPMPISSVLRTILRSQRSLRMHLVLPGASLMYRPQQRHVIPVRRLPCRADPFCASRSLREGPQLTNSSAGRRRRQRASEIGVHH
jgi:hypothetical protein